MTVTLDAGLEGRVRKAASLAGQEVGRYVEAALLRQVAQDEARARAARLREEMREAASDPLFLADVEETGRDFVASDAETARMLGS